MSQRKPVGVIPTLRNPRLALASASEAVKLVCDPAWCCRVQQRRFSPSTMLNSSTILNSLGANDEYLRKNHERDLRHQGRRRSRGRWCRCRHRFFGRIDLRIGCTGPNRRCRADSGQGGRRQEGKIGMADVNCRSDEGARYRFQPRCAQGTRQGARLHRRYQ